MTLLVTEYEYGDQLHPLVFRSWLPTPGSIVSRNWSVPMRVIGGRGDGWDRGRGQVSVGNKVEDGGRGHRRHKQEGKRKVSEEGRVGLVGSTLLVRACMDYLGLVGLGQVRPRAHKSGGALGAYTMLD